MLHYDLQILYEHMQQYSVSRAVIYFQNCESFDTNVLADLIDVLRSGSSHTVDCMDMN